MVFGELPPSSQISLPPRRDLGRHSELQISDIKIQETSERIMNRFSFTPDFEADVRQLSQQVLAEFQLLNASAAGDPPGGGDLDEYLQRVFAEFARQVRWQRKFEEQHRQSWSEFLEKASNQALLEDLHEQHLNGE